MEITSHLRVIFFILMRGVVPFSLQGVRVEMSIYTYIVLFCGMEQYYFQRLSIFTRSSYVFAMYKLRCRSVVDCD